MSWVMLHGTPVACPPIQLPDTCPQNRRFYTDILLLTRIKPDAWNGAGFEGRRYRTGARIPAAELGERPILLESAGPQGTWRRGKKRENLRILWRYDWTASEWKEIARALAFSWEWIFALREAAIQAMRPAAAESADSTGRGIEVTEGLLHAIDAALVLELPAVRAHVLTSIYDRMAGRLLATAAPPVIPISFFQMNE